MASRSAICGASLRLVASFLTVLALQNENHEAGNKYIPYTKMASWLIEWKLHPDTQWLKDAPSQPLQQSLKDLERGYKNFFQKRAAFPRFKKRGHNDAFSYPQGVKLDQANNRISFPWLGWVRYRNSREVLGEVKNVTASLSCGKWYVRIQTEYEVADQVHRADSIVGLDAGITKLAALSDGTVYHPVNSFKANQRNRGVSAKLASKLNYLWRSCTGELSEQNDLSRLTYALETVKDMSWNYRLLSDREWSGRYAVSLNAGVNGIYLSRTNLDAAFDDDGRQNRSRSLSTIGSYL